MSRILFVDDDVLVLEELKQVLTSLCPHWQMEFVEGGAKALQLLKLGTWDAVVADYLMPHMDGLELMTQIMQIQPGVIRIILSGRADWKVNLQIMKVTHQYLTKPCNHKILVDVLERSLALRERLAEARVKRLVAQLPALPSLPRLYLDLLEQLRSDDSSAEQIGKLIARDPSMCAKLLQLVNSAFFGLPQRVLNPTEAVLYLGVETVKALVLSLQIFALFERIPVREFSYEGLWSHSWLTGQLAKHIAELELADTAASDQAFSSGLLHDVGKLILVTGLPNRYRECLVLQHQKGFSSWQAERQIFSCSHAEAGAYLMGLWGLPQEMVESVAYHHEPGKNPSRQFTTLTAVHTANALLHHEPVNESDPVERGLDQDYLARLGLLGRLDSWREQAAKLRDVPRRRL